MRLRWILPFLMLAGCVTTGNNNYGSGPLPPFTPAVQQEIATYLARQELDRALAVSPDGRFISRSYCVRYDSISRCSNNEVLAVADCKRRSGQECKIFASDNQVVWKSPSVTPSPQAGWRVSMEIGGQTFSGTAQTSNVPGLQLFQIESPEGSCQGAIVISGSAGSWSATCKSGVSAAGKITAVAANSSNGEGQDSTGRLVKFTATKL